MFWIIFITAAITFSVCAYLMPEDGYPKYLEVWVGADGTVPLLEGDKVIGKPEMGPWGYPIAQVLIAKRKTYLDRAHKEFIRRSDIMEAK